jgi:3-oxoisoapionate decarboxylase
MIKLGIETFSYHLQMDAGLMDAFGFVDAARELGLDGVQINIGPGRGTYGHLGSIDPGHLRELREEVARNGMFIEIDTRGTDPDFIIRSLHLCSDLGADVLRLYAPPENDLDVALDKAVTGFRTVLPVCQDLGVRIAFENHEYETSERILGVVRTVDSEWVGTHVDTGNSMMMWENPVNATKALSEFAVSSHLKDHVVVRQKNEVAVAGVTLGEGNASCAECFQILCEESPLKRVVIEDCYGYRAPFRIPQHLGAGAKLGQGAFEIVEPPYDPAFIPAPRADRSPAQVTAAIAFQKASVQKSVAFVKSLLAGTDPQL